MLLTFGSAIGLSVVSFEPREGASLVLDRRSSAGSGSSGSPSPASAPAATSPAGCAARPPGASVDEVELRDGAHGLLVWATGALLGAVLAATGVTGAIGAAGRATGTVAQTAAEAVGGDIDYLGERLMRGADGADPQAARRRPPS